MIVGNGQIDMSNQIGGISLLIAALTWALMSVLIKRVPSNYSPIVVTTYSILVAIIILTPFVWVNLDEVNFSQLTHPTVWGGLLFLGIISTACAFILWNRGLQRINASSGGLFFFFQPLVGTLLGWLLLGESIGGTFWVGSILILIGVLLVIREKSRITKKETCGITKSKGFFFHINESMLFVQESLKRRWLESDEMQELMKEVPIGRVAKPEEVASIVLWLCSPSASYVIGQGIAVDGGYTVH
jgi:uncharacterized membrane protein